MLELLYLLDSKEILKVVTTKKVNVSKKLDKDNLPKKKYSVITMDGNGRWAKTQGKFRIFGHENGVKAVKDTVEAGRNRN